MEVIVEIQDCKKVIPKGAKILIGTREYDLKKVVHLNGNVYTASLSYGDEDDFTCRVSAEHEVIVPASPSKSKDKDPDKGKDKK